MCYMKFRCLAHYYGPNKRITQTINGKIKHVTFKNSYPIIIIEHTLRRFVFSLKVISNTCRLCTMIKFYCLKVPSLSIFVLYFCA